MMCDPFIHPLMHTVYRSLLILLLYVFKSSTRWQTIVADDCGKVLFWNDCIFDYDIQLNSILSMNVYNRELTYE